VIENQIKRQQSILGSTAEDEEVCFTWKKREREREKRDKRERRERRETEMQNINYQINL